MNKNNTPIVIVFGRCSFASPFDAGNPNGPSPFATASTSKLDDCVPLGTQVTSTQTPSNVKRKKKKKKKKNPEYLDRGNESSIMSQGKK